MAYQDYFYTNGTITVTNGSTAIVGSGTAWQLRHAVGAIVFVGTSLGFIASVQDETHATLTQAWAGPTSAGAAYTMWLVTGEAAQNLANNQRLSEIIQSLNPAQPINANLTAISNLVGALDMVMVFTGPGTFRLAPKSEFTSGVNYNAYVSDITGRAAFDLQTAGYGVMVANAPGDNVLANPGFEGGTANWSFLTGITIDAANQRTGVNCAKLDKGVVGAGGTQRTLATGNSYPVVAGEAYTVAAWIKGSGVSTAGLVIQVLWRDALNAAISTVNAVANVAFTASYVQYSGTLTAPPGAAFAYIAIAIATTATAQSIYVDDVTSVKQLSGRAALYVKNSATSGDWSLPSYITGPAGGLASIAVGTVTTLNPGTPATVVNAGTPTSPVLNFGIPKGRGMSWKGDYNPATAYIVDDAVLYNSSSWICIANTTGNAPPALPTTVNTWWQLQAAKGVGDVSGPASSTDGHFALFSGGTGKAIADSVYTPESFTGPENLCLNGDFDIWQRGISFSSQTLAYHADRWRFISNGTGTKNVQLGTFPMGQTDVPGTPKYYLSTSINPAGAGATFCSLATAMECFWQTAGRKVTVTIYIRSSTGAAMGANSILLRQNFGTGGSPSADVDYILAPNLTIPNSATWQKLQYVVTLGGTAGKTLGTSGTEHLALYFQYPLNTTNSQIELAHVSVVLGDATTLADPFTKINRTQTMLLCQRYFEPMITADMFGMQRTSVANQYAVLWWYATSKYKTPAIAFTNGANGSAFAVYENQPNHLTLLYSAASANIYAITSASSEAEII